VSRKTTDLIEREIGIYLLAYNLIQLLMMQLALLADIPPRHHSFKHTTVIVVTVAP
jgi:hypothetical protein